eukprot:scaffold16900_cov105-Isochrysis_galbana.AAC.2
MAPPFGAASLVGSTASSQAFFGDVGGMRPGEKGGRPKEDIGLQSAAVQGRGLPPCLNWSATRVFFLTGCQAARYSAAGTRYNSSPLGEAGQSFGLPTGPPRAGHPST